jgi:ATP synthase protein I
VRIFRRGWVSILDSPWKAMILVSLIGANLAVSIFLGYWGGRYLDQWMNSGSVFMIVGILLGMAVGIYGITKLIKPFIGE